MFADRGEPEIIIPAAALIPGSVWRLHLAEILCGMTSRIVKSYLLQKEFNAARYERAVRLLFVTAALEGKYDALVSEFTKQLLMR